MDQTFLATTTPNQPTKFARSHGFIMAPVPVAHGHGPFAQVQAAASLVTTTNTRSSDLSAPRHPGCWRSALFFLDG